jgi:hypothetical protein
MNLIILKIIIFIIIITNIQPIESKVFLEKENLLREGKWINRGVKNIIGEGTDRIIEINKNENDFEMLITEIKYYSVNDKERDKPGKQIKGPYKIKIIDNLLKIEDQTEIDIKTFRYEKGMLVWPAIVKTKNNSWYYKSNKDEYSFVCDDNPEMIEIGNATFSSTSSKSIGWEQYYRLIKPNNKIEKERRDLIFYEKNKDGKTYEWAKLIWDTYGNPRFEGTSWYLLNEVRYSIYSDMEN